MTEQEKQLLLIDLCARLPYGVKCDKDGEMYDLVSIEVPQGFVRLKKMVNGWIPITQYMTCNDKQNADAFHNIECYVAFLHFIHRLF